jgi:transposase
MTGKQRFMYSRKAFERLRVIHKALDGDISQAEAARILSLTLRQTRRIMERVRVQGQAGVIHKSRGRPSNRSLPKETRDRVINLYREKYKGLGPTLASEKLSDEDKIKVNHETLRRWLIESGDWEKNGRKRRDLTFIVTDKSSRPKNSVRIRKVIVKNKRDGDIHQTDKKIERNIEKQQDKEYIIAPKKKYIPPQDHPWRRLMNPQYAS